MFDKHGKYAALVCYQYETSSIDENLSKYQTESAYCVTVKSGF